MLCPVSTVPHAVVTPNHAIISLLLHSCQSATVASYNVNTVEERSLPRAVIHRLRTAMLDTTWHAVSLVQMEKHAYQVNTINLNRPWQARKRTSSLNNLVGIHAINKTDKLKQSSSEHIPWYPSEALPEWLWQCQSTQASLVLIDLVKEILWSQQK